MQQGNGSVGSPSLSMQDSPHSMKIKQESFQLSPTSLLPSLHQGKCLYFDSKIYIYRSILYFFKILIFTWKFIVNV